MMLRHLNLHDTADKIQNSALNVIKEGKYRTKDLGGSSSCSEYTNAVCERVKN